MEFTPTTILYIVITAIVPGLIATWLGVGGCFLRIPMLMYFFGVSIKTAYCVNQAVVALTTIPGVVVHIRSKHVYLKGLAIAVPSAMLGVALGAYIVAKYLPTLLLRAIFGFVCLGIGIYIAYRTLRARRVLTKRVTVADVKKLYIGPKLGLLMFLAGFATGICGFGGGIYFVPIYLGLAYPTHVAIGTSSFQMLPVAGMGSAVLALNGYGSLELFLAIGIPTLIASWIGAKLAARSPPWFLRLLYAIGISGAGLYVALDALTRL